MCNVIFTISGSKDRKHLRFNVAFVQCEQPFKRSSINNTFSPKNVVHITVRINTTDMSIYIWWLNVAYSGAGSSTHARER